MKDSIPRFFKRHILLSPLEILLILVLLGGTVGVGVYAQYTLVKVRQGLPAEILRQAGDLTLLIQDLAALVHAVELAVLDPEPKRRELIIIRNESLRNRLAIIQSYEFDNLVGAAAIYALVNPASEDIQRWLSTGLPGLAVDSSLVMRLVEIRARDAHNRARDLSLHSQCYRFSAFRPGNDTLRAVSRWRFNPIGMLGFIIFRGDWSVYQSTSR